ncbi:hypothetical protein [Streptomyces xiamenensis]|uniref:hypothetical protein n=1 Tax=Streptomyces xiamenensis TaxID=408015 RepID=UPI0006287022|nr:hypothetical protein [Streptomyces xiamenensis]
MALVVLLAVVGDAFALLTWVGPRQLYWAFGAWAHRDPQANEPSDAAYTVQRFGYIALSATSFVGALSTAHWQGTFTSEEARVRQAVEKAAERMEEADVTSGGSANSATGRYNSQVQSAVRQASPHDLELVATHVSGEQYTVTTAAGEHPFCLVVRASSQDVYVPGAEGSTSTTSYLKLSVSAREGACG